MKRLLPIAILFLGFTAPLYLMRNANAAEDAGVVAGCGSAAGSAATAPAVTVVVPDPATDPLGDASAAYRLYKAGALVPAIIVVSYLLLSLASKKISWLQETKRAAYVAAGIGFLSACIPAAAQGQTPNLAMLLTALGAAIALVLHPTPPATDVAKS